MALEAVGVSLLVIETRFVVIRPRRRRDDVPRIATHAGSKGVRGLGVVGWNDTIVNADTIFPELQHTLEIVGGDWRNGDGRMGVQNDKMVN